MRRQTEDGRRNSGGGRARRRGVRRGQRAHRHRWAAPRRGRAAETPRASGCSARRRRRGALELRGVAAGSSLLEPHRLHADGGGHAAHAHLGGHGRIVRQRGRGEREHRTVCERGARSELSPMLAESSGSRAENGSISALQAAWCMAREIRKTENRRRRFTVRDVQICGGASDWEELEVVSFRGREKEKKSSCYSLFRGKLAGQDWAARPVEARRLLSSFSASQNSSQKFPAR